MCEKGENGSPKTPSPRLRHGGRLQRWTSSKGTCSFSSVRQADDPAARREAQSVSGIRAKRLSSTLFVLWGFPEPSQTFIQRELMALQQIGEEIQLLAGYRIERDDLCPELLEIERRTLYLGKPLWWAFRGLGYAAAHPLRFGEALLWMGALPHRGWIFRLRGMAMLLAAGSVADRVRERGITCVHAHFASYQTELAMCLSRLLGIPYGWTGHARGIWRDRNLLVQKVAGARVVITCTQFNARHLREIAPGHADKVKVIHHGLDLGALPPVPALPGGEPARFLAVGRLVPKKGFVDLIRAGARLRDSGIDYRLAIIGEGPEGPRLRREIERYGLEQRIYLLGALSNREVFEHLGQSHALLAPSVQDEEGDIDGIPNVLLEAMSMKRAVIGSDLSGLPEVIEHERTGLLVAPGEVEQLASAMRRLAEDRELLRSMGERGRRLIEVRFDLRKTVAEQLELLNPGQPSARS